MTRVVIAGGGIAAIETLIALRAAPRGSQLDVTVIAPGDRLVYRPLSVLEPFQTVPPRHYPLDAICGDFGARLMTDALVRVDGEAHVAVTAAGERIAYDQLVIAVGARPHPALPHADMQVSEADGYTDAMRRVVRDLETGVAHDLALVVPPGSGWALPLYELALMTARHLRDAGVDDARVALVTQEEVALAIFRGRATAVVERLLERAGVELLTSAYVERYDGATLTIAPGARTRAADRVVALPALAGPALDGVPCDADGFVHADEYHRVPGLDGVYAIGDATTFPVKQGGIAAQHADLVAALIARSAGPDRTTRPRLRAILLTGDEPLYLQATITGGRSVASSASPHCPWWPPHKVAARHLAPYLADRLPLAVPPPLARR